MLTGPAGDTARRSARLSTPCRRVAAERPTTDGTVLDPEARAPLCRARERGARDRGGAIAAQALSERQHRLSRGRPRRLPVRDPQRTGEGLAARRARAGGDRADARAARLPR